LEVAQFLVLHGADKEKTDGDGGTPLYLGAMTDQLALVRHLVEQGADKDKVSRRTGRTPLYVAASGGFLDIVQYLVQQGADKEKTASNGNTALHAAANAGRRDVVVCLLSHGAKLDVRNKAGELPIDVADTEEIKQIIRDDEQCRRVLARSLADMAAYANDELLTAVKRGNIDEVRSCCFGANVDINWSHQDEEGMAALIAAVTEGHLEVMECLLEHGADKDKAAIDGWTPLYAAAFWGHSTMAQYLVLQGADMEKADNIERTPLHAAATMDHLEVVRYLIEQGANKEKADINNRTPLHCAAAAGRTSIVVCLLSHGAKLSARNKAHELPVDVATTEEIKQIIRDEEQRRRDLIRSRVSASQDAAGAAVAAND
jgi:ankyrin repeat protein